MNERILELARQAANGMLSYDAEGDWRLSEKEVEYFAELIVLECVKEIEFLYEGGSDRPIDDEWNRAIECASSMVKYRFGVEE